MNLLFYISDEIRASGRIDEILDIIGSHAKYEDFFSVPDEIFKINRPLSQLWKEKEISFKGKFNKNGFHLRHIKTRVLLRGDFIETCDETIINLRSYMGFIYWFFVILFSGLFGVRAFFYMNSIDTFSWLHLTGFLWVPLVIYLFQSKAKKTMKEFANCIRTGCGTPLSMRTVRSTMTISRI